MKTNPGSKEAIELGCVCPVTDNHYGKGFYMSQSDTEPKFWISGECTLHTL